MFDQKIAADADRCLVREAGAVIQAQKFSKYMLIRVQIRKFWKLYVALRHLIIRVSHHNFISKFNGTRDTEVTRDELLSMDFCMDSYLT